jgi:hypothetical protein
MTPCTLKLINKRALSTVRGLVSRVANTHLTILSAIVLIWLEKQYSCRPSLVAVMDEVPVEYRMFFLIAPPSGSLICDVHKSGKAKEKKGYFTQKSMSKWPPPPT